MPYFTLWMLDFFNTIQVSNSLDPDQSRHFVRPDLGPNYFQGLSADNKMSGWIWVQTVCKGYQQTTKVGKELNTKKLVDTTLWLKPWLKLISLGYNFFQFGYSVGYTQSEPELALPNIKALGPVVSDKIFFSRYPYRSLCKTFDPREQTW